MSLMGVRREKAALSSGCKPHPATAPAGSNRSQIRKATTPRGRRPRPRAFTRRSPRGSPTHQQITAAGDTINVASRLLEVAKQQHCRVDVMEDLLAAARATLPLAD